MARVRLDSRDNQVGQAQALELPASGPVGELRDSIEQMDTPRFKEKAKNLAFAEELVEIMIPITGNPNDEQFILVRNNGSVQAIERGKPQWVRRKYLEVLARAKYSNIATPEYIDAAGNRAVKITKTPGHIYPFVLLTDKNPDGVAWLSRINSEY